MWRSFLKDYFSFSAADRNGIIVLCAIILLIILLTWVLPGIYVSGSKNDHYEFREAALSFYSNDTVDIETIREEKADLFYFDPNQLTAEEMSRLGFGDRLIRTMQNYLNRGGKFFRKEDMLKIYGMTDSLYSSIEPFILINQLDITVPGEASVEFVKELIELNSADSVQLRKLPGIGSVLSARIIKYRNLLGGFYKIDQLKEVYGISDDQLDNFKDMLYIDTTRLKKLNLRNSAFSDLLRHPYITYPLAGRISGFIKINPGFKDLEELLSEGILDTADYSRLKPYLETNQD